MKYGFMLIEVMIASLIATMVAAALFVSINQINKYSLVVDDYTGIYTHAAIVHKQLERDLTGFFIPIAGEIKKDTKDAKSQDQKINQDDKRKKKKKILLKQIRQKKKRGNKTNHQTVLWDQ